MKTWTSIIAACVILAFAASATAGLPGDSGSNAGRPGTVYKPLKNVDQKLLSKRAAQLKALSARNKALLARNRSLGAANSSLASENQALLNRISAILWENRKPIETPVINECQTSGNNCTPKESCEIWGYDCDLVPPAPPADTAVTESQSSDATS